MLTRPILKNNIIYLTITEEFYVFGRCDGYKVVQSIEPEHCWVSIDNNNKIICGNDAYKSKNKVRFQIFTNMRNRHEYIEQLQKGIQLSDCYDSMLKYIIKKIHTTKNQINSIVLIVSQTIIPAIRNYIIEKISDILKGKNSQIQIHGFLLSSAFAYALYYEVANTRQPGRKEEPEYNEERYFLTINFDNTSTQIDLFKGQQYTGFNKTVTIGINDDNEKPKYLSISHDTYRKINRLIKDSNEIIQNGEILNLENKFRELLNNCIINPSEELLKMVEERILYNNVSDPEYLINKECDTYYARQGLLKGFTASLEVLLQQALKYQFLFLPSLLLCF